MVIHNRDFKPHKLVSSYTSNKQILLKQLESNSKNIGEKEVARDSLKVKQVMDRKRIFSLTEEFPND